jgi:hypothetical protein
LSPVLPLVSLLLQEQAKINESFYPLLFTVKMMGQRY